MSEPVEKIFSAMEEDYPDHPKSKKEKRLYTPLNVMMLVWICGIIIAFASVILSYIFLSRTEIRWLFPDYSKHIIPLIIAIFWGCIYWRMRK